MTTRFTTETYLGGVTLQKTANANGVAVGTAWKLPVVSGIPTNPRNWVYPPVTNAGAGPTTGSIGKRTPLVTLSFPLKMNYLDVSAAYGYATMFNEMMGGTLGVLDGGYTTSEFAVVFDEPILGQEFYTYFHFMGLDIIYAAPGGPIMAQVTGCGIYGDSEDGSPPTVAAYSSAVAGQDYGTADVILTGVDQADGMQISILRAQALQQTSNGTLYANAVTSGATGGSVSFSQSMTATMSAPTAFTLGTTANKGFEIAFVTNLDGISTPWGLGSRRSAEALSLVDFTGATFAHSYPYSITAL